jgi:hypothetical protein
MKAAAGLYHAYFTGLILTLVTRRSAADAAEWVFRTFRHQHHEKFLSSFGKLGLRSMPDAVACAAYHYLSNSIGGVTVEFMRESDRKAWVNFVPPRWIYPGASICGVPSEVSRAFLRGWYAQNGVSLGNPRLGFVCTGQTVNGHPGLEGYYVEHDRDLAEDERVRFAPGEAMPDADPARAPRLDPAAWPAERLELVVSRYAMEYVRTALPVLLELLGPADTRRVLGHAARLIGMQYHDETMRLLGIADSGPAAFARYLAALAAAQGEEVTVSGEPGRARVRQKGWRLARGLEPLDAAAFDAWAELWHGALAAHDRWLRLSVTREAGTIDFVITSR